MVLITYRGLGKKVYLNQYFPDQKNKQQNDWYELPSLSLSHLILLIYIA